MATEQGLRQALELSASNFHPRNADQWVEDMLAAWMRHPTIANASDAAVEVAMIDHMGAGQFAPKLADIVSRLKQGRAPAAAPAGKAGQDCPDCGGTGWREVSATFQIGDDISLEGPFAALCGCKNMRGVRWEDWINGARSRPNVVNWWVTGRNMRMLPDEARLTPRQLRDRAERRATPGGRVIAFTPNPEAKDARLAERKRLIKQVADEWLEVDANAKRMAE